MSFDGNVTVNIFGAAQAVPKQNFGLIGALSSDVGAGFTERFRLYLNSKEVDDDSDVNSDLATYVKNIFAQNQNPGQVAILRADPSEAQVEKWTIGGVIANLDTFTITVNSIPVTDTATVPADDAAAVALSLRTLLTAALAAEPVVVSGAGVEVIVTATHPGEAFTFSSSKVSVAGTITESTTNANVTLADSLSAIKVENDTWYGLVTDSRDPWELLAIAAWVETDDSKFFACQTDEAGILTAAAGNMFAAMFALAYSRTMPIYHPTDTETVDLAWLGFKLAKDPDTGPTQWSGATLVGCTIATLTATQQTNLLAKSGNAYLSEMSLGSAGPGTLVDTRYADTLVTKDWFKARIREGATQLRLNLSNLNRKAGFNDTGVAMYAAVLEEWIKRGEDVEHFEKGASTITVPKASSFSDSDRLARKITIPADVALLGGIEKVTYNLAVLDVA